MRLLNNMEYGDKLETLYRKSLKIKSVMESCLDSPKEDAYDSNTLKLQRLEAAHKWGMRVIANHKVIDCDNLSESMTFFRNYYLPILNEIDKLYHKIKKQITC